MGLPIFQGTVLGPTLWNCFFADVSANARAHGGMEILFADDLVVHHAPGEDGTLTTKASSKVL